MQNQKTKRNSNGKSKQKEAKGIITGKRNNAWTIWKVYNLLKQHCKILKGYHGI